MNIKGRPKELVVSHFLLESGNNRLGKVKDRHQYSELIDLMQGEKRDPMQ